MSRQTRRLILAANRVASTGDRLGAAFARALGTVLRGLERQLDRLLRETVAGSRSALVRAAQTQQLRVELRNALRASGYDDLASSALGARLDVMTDQVLKARRIARQSAEFVGAMSERLLTLRVVQLDALLGEGDSIARALSQAALQGIVGNRSIDLILNDLGALIDDTEPHIRTLYDTSVSIYGRAVEATLAGDDPETPFVYLGPADDVTRPFCLKHVGKVYTRSEIDALDNGQLPDVFLTGGGYQCRHTWTEVSKFSALTDLGARRMPEIAERVRELKRAA